jgi:hypothetical protein
MPDFVGGWGYGNTRSLDSMLPSFLKNSKTTRGRAPSETNKIIYKAESRTELAKTLKVNLANISRFIKNEDLYLGRLIFSEGSLEEVDYITSLMSPADLLDYVNKLRSI